MKPEPQLEIAADVPEPPAFITGYAADEWWRTAPELHRLGSLTHATQKKAADLSATFVVQTSASHCDHRPY
jgi:phage terminase small subunit